MSNLPNDLTFRSPLFEAPRQDAGVGKESFAKDTREPYQRDLGRIVHSASFRRLQTKTQVMGTGEGDFHRTRLTHSLEVGQIGRGIVWNLAERVSPDTLELLPPAELIEAICYAHDLGHPPFGHGGERALHSKMKTMGGFEGNAQTLRILTRLEKYYRGEGTKPTRRLVLGVLKYPVKFGDYAETQRMKVKPPKCYYDEEKHLVERALSMFAPDDVKEFTRLGEDGKPVHKTLDCSIMELADDIAYGVHDLEDGIGRGILKREIVEPDILKGFAAVGVDKIREVAITSITQKLFSGDSHERKHAISLLVGYFIMSIDVVALDLFTSPLLDRRATVPPDTRKLLDHLAKDITYESLIKRREVQTLEYKGEKMLCDLFDAFAERPVELVGLNALDPLNSSVSSILEKARKENAPWLQLDDSEKLPIARAISDFIAGMTNPYAERYHRRLFEPGFGSSTDEM